MKYFLVISIIFNIYLYTSNDSLKNKIFGVVGKSALDDFSSKHNENITNSLHDILSSGNYILGFKDYRYKIHNIKNVTPVLSKGSNLLDNTGFHEIGLEGTFSEIPKWP